MTVTVSDGQGGPVRDGGLARWLAGVVPARSRGEVAIALVTDRHIQKLNQQYRGKAAPTDVLSFAADEDATDPNRGSRKTGASPKAGSRAPGSGPRFLGDIVIATGVAKRQAREAGHSYATELRVLALHGLLHLLGYDHDSPADRGRMRRAEARMRRAGGLREGLIARTTRDSASGQPERPAGHAAQRRRRGRARDGAAFAKAPASLAVAERRRGAPRATRT